MSKRYPNGFFKNSPSNLLDASGNYEGAVFKCSSFLDTAILDNFSGNIVSGNLFIERNGDQNYPIEVGIEIPILVEPGDEFRLKIINGVPSNEMKSYQIGFRASGEENPALSESSQTLSFSSASTSSGSSSSSSPSSSSDSSTDSSDSSSSESSDSSSLSSPSSQSLSSFSSASESSVTNSSQSESTRSESSRSESTASESGSYSTSFSESSASESTKSESSVSESELSESSQEEFTYYLYEGCVDSSVKISLDRNMGDVIQFDGGTLPGGGREHCFQLVGTSNSYSDAYPWVESSYVVGAYDTPEECLDAVVEESSESSESFGITTKYLQWAAPIAKVDLGSIKACDKFEHIGGWPYCIPNCSPSSYGSKWTGYGSINGRLGIDFPVNEWILYDVHPQICYMFYFAPVGVTPEVELDFVREQCPSCEPEMSSSESSSSESSLSSESSFSSDSSESTSSSDSSDSSKSSASTDSSDSTGGSSDSSDSSDSTASSDSSASSNSSDSSNSSNSSDSGGGGSSASSFGSDVTENIGACSDPCSLDITFRTYTVADRLIVTDGTGVQLDTGYISTGNNFNSYSLTGLTCPVSVCVDAPSGGTAWDLTAHGCGLDLVTSGGQGYHCWETIDCANPTMALTVTGASGTINWCGRSWVLPGESGVTKYVCPTNYTLVPNATSSITITYTGPSPTSVVAKQYFRYYDASALWQYGTNDLWMQRRRTEEAVSTLPYGFKYCNQVWGRNRLKVNGSEDYQFFTRAPHGSVPCLDWTNTLTSLKLSDMQAIVGYSPTPTFSRTYFPAPDLGAVGFSGNFFNSVTQGGITYTWAQGGGW